MASRAARAGAGPSRRCCAPLAAPLRRGGRHEERVTKSACRQAGQERSALPSARGKRAAARAEAEGAGQENEPRQQAAEGRRGDSTHVCVYAPITVDGVTSGRWSEMALHRRLCWHHSSWKNPCRWVLLECSRTPSTRISKFHSLPSSTTASTPSP